MPLIRLVAFGVLAAIVVAGLTGVYSTEHGGVFVLLAAAYGAGLAAGRWWALLLAAAPPVAGLPAGDGDPPSWIVGLLLVAPLLGLAVALGVLSSKLIAGLRPRVTTAIDRTSGNAAGGNSGRSFVQWG